MFSLDLGDEGTGRPIAGIWERRYASFDKLRMRVFHRATKIFPHPELVEGRTKPLHAGWRARHRACASLCIAVALALTVAACGKRGDPVRPDGQSDEYPRQYPDPSSL
ncbi:MAG: hypothetical protein AB7S71_22500 [Dongiaceae bacterium]